MHQLLDEMASVNGATLPVAAEHLAQTIAGGGIIHAFGSGHSSLLAQEVFHRAGGLAPINAMLDANLTIFGTSRPTWLERTEGYAASLFVNHDVRAGEVVLIISNSGINPVPIEVAKEARKRGAFAIAVGSAAAYAGATSRHSSGQTLFDVADLVLDTRVPVGDALQAIGEDGVSVGAASTILGSALLNELIIATAQALAAHGDEVPVFTSQNVPGGDAANADLLERYRPRIPLMKP
jgi:uncharacterized phosphosugar-binding protein